MRKEETNDILLYPIGFDISRLYNSLVYGVMSEDDYKKRGVDFIKSSYDPIHTDEVNLYKYEDYVNDALPGRKTNYINNSICLSIESDVLVFPISKENIISIAIPSCYADTSLNEINYLNFSNMSYEQIKNNCDTFLKALEKYGFIKDQDKYDSSYDVLRYSYNLGKDFEEDQLEDARNYLNEDIGYDVRDTFRKILNKQNEITLLDLINYLNEQTLKLPIVTLEDISLVKRKTK